MRRFGLTVKTKGIKVLCILVDTFRDADSGFFEDFNGLPHRGILSQWKSIHEPDLFSIKSALSCELGLMSQEDRDKCMHGFESKVVLTGSSRVFFS